MNFKKILIFGGLALILIGGGAYAYLNLLGGGEHGEADADGEETASAEAPAAETPAPAPAPKSDAASDASNSDYDDDSSSGEDDEAGIVAVNQIHVINLPRSAKGVRGSFLKAQFSIFVRDQELGKQMSSDTPTPEREEARAIILDILSTMTAEEVMDNEIRYTIRQDIMDRLNERFRPRPSADKKAPPRPKKPIKDVLIVEWAVQ